jgi:hypothetical protein
MRMPAGCNVYTCLKDKDGLVVPGSGENGCVT